MEIPWLQLIGVLILIIITFDVVGRMRISKRIGNIPIVSKIPIIGTLLLVSRISPDNLHLKFGEFVQRFGKTFYARIFGVTVVVTADNRYVDALLSSQIHIRKHMLYLLLRSWLNNGLLLSYGSRWQRMRRIVTPTFHFKILEQFVEVFDKQSSIFIKKLQQFSNGTTCIDIYPLMGLLTLDIIAETAMGVEVNAQLDSKSDFVQAVKDVTNILATRFVRPFLIMPWLFRILAPRLYWKQRQGIEIMHKFTENIITKRRKALEYANSKSLELNQSEEKDLKSKSRMALLDVLLQYVDANGNTLSDEDIRAEVNTFMFEGHDTTTSATSFCLYLLSRNPDSQQKLYEEIHAYFGDDLTRPITYFDLQNLTFLNCVIKESLRMFPPIPAIGRWLKEDLKIDNVTLPAGTNVIVLIWQLLRDPEIFPEPDIFKPERHMETSARGTAYTNIPFSAGPRNCIGQRFALQEIRTIVIKMLRHFKLLELGPDVEPSIKIVLRSKTGVNFGLEPRNFATL